MQPDFERRRSEREKYLVLRLYARLLTWMGYIALVGGTLFAALVIPLAEEPMPARIFTAFVSAVSGVIYFLILRATAQAIYLLFDVARNSKASRELLEKAGGAAAAAAPKPAPAD